MLCSLSLSLSLSVCTEPCQRSTSRWVALGAAGSVVVRAVGEKDGDTTGNTLNARVQTLLYKLRPGGGGGNVRSLVHRATPGAIRLAEGRPGHTIHWAVQSWSSRGACIAPSSGCRSGCRTGTSSSTQRGRGAGSALLCIERANDIEREERSRQRADSWRCPGSDTSRARGSFARPRPCSPTNPN